MRLNVILSNLGRQEDPRRCGRKRRKVKEKKIYKYLTIWKMVTKPCRQVRTTARDFPNMNSYSNDGTSKSHDVSKMYRLITRGTNQPERSHQHKRPGATLDYLPKMGRFGSAAPRIRNLLLDKRSAPVVIHAGSERGSIKTIPFRMHAHPSRPYCGK